MNKEVWLAGRYVWNKASEAYDKLWLVQGVFSTEALAREACRDSTYFIMPLQLNESLPPEPLENSRAYYPLQMAEVV